MRMNDIVTLGRLSLTTTLSSTITGEFLTTTFTKTKIKQECKKKYILSEWNLNERMNMVTLEGDCVTFQILRKLSRGAFKTRKTKRK